MRDRRTDAVWNAHPGYSSNPDGRVCEMRKTKAEKMIGLR